MTIPTQTTENTEQKVAAQAQKDVEINIERARKALENERAERKRLEAELAQFKQKPLTAPVQEDDIEDSSEPYVDHRLLNKRLKKMESEFERRIEEKADQRARSLIQEERKNAYLKENNDFHTVMNEEVMDKFVQKFPSLAQGILNMPDGFERQKLVYENIKALGLHKKEETKPAVQDRIDQNRRSPFQPSSMGTAPYGTNGDFSKGGQKSAYEKMQALKARLGVS